MTANPIYAHLGHPWRPLRPQPPAGASPEFRDEVESPMTTETPETPKRKRNTSRAAEEALAAEGGVAEPVRAPEGSADRVLEEPIERADGWPVRVADALDDVEDGPIGETEVEEGATPLTAALAAAVAFAETREAAVGHNMVEPPHIAENAYANPSPEDICPQCGWSRADHQDYDPARFAPIRVNTGGADGADAEVKPRKRKAKEETAAPRNAQGELPGVPSGGMWGEYQGRRVAYVKLGFGGGPGAPRELAGHLDLGARCWLHISGTVAGNQHKRDKEGDTYESVSLFVDTVSVDRIEEPPAPSLPTTLMRKAVLLDFVTRALALVKAGPDEGEGGMTAAAWELVGDVSRAFDPSEVTEAEASE